MTTAHRPSYWEIVSAYIEEGYRAWQAREDASGTAVEASLGGFSVYEAIDWHRELEDLGLIVMVDVMNAIGAYRLAPRGLAFAERMPDIERLMAQQTTAINRTAMAEEEKRQAGFSLRDEIYKTAISKGADVAIQNASTIWSLVRSLYTALPHDWRGVV